MPTAREPRERKAQETITAYDKIPYALINAEIEGSASDVYDEFAKILKYYKVYKKGADFLSEGTAGDYQASRMKYKLSASLINKEARFMFSKTPDVIIALRGDKAKASDEAKAGISVLQEMVNKILEKNMFQDVLLKAAKDCFIAKRIAGVLNFNEETGVEIKFLPSLNFIYETKMNSDVLKKFVMFVIVKDKMNRAEKRIFKKKYELVETHDEETGTRKEMCWVEEVLYDGAGVEVEMLTEFQPTLLDFIPATVFANDGLTGETAGESEVDLLEDYESNFSKLANADIDAERKSMNPIRYTVDMSNNSTKNLSSRPGSYWDLKSDQNTEQVGKGTVGMLESTMGYSTALTTTLDRIKSQAHDQVEVPNVTPETLSGTITSGKGMKALYWPLIVRCEEKMKMWGPNLRFLIDAIIKGAIVYPDTIAEYTEETIPMVEYEVKIEMNYALPEDDKEEKETDLSEVSAGAMSRATYMKKWRELSQEEVDEELKQLYFEKQLLEDGMNMFSEEPVDEEAEAVGGEEDWDDEEDTAEAEEEDDGQAELDALIAEIDKLGGDL